MKANASERMEPEGCERPAFRLSQAKALKWRKRSLRFSNTEPGRAANAVSGENHLFMGFSEHAAPQRWCRELWRRRLSRSARAAQSIFRRWKTSDGHPSRGTLLEHLKDLPQRKAPIHNRRRDSRYASISGMEHSLTAPAVPSLHAQEPWARARKPGREPSIENVPQAASATLSAPFFRKGGLNRGVAETQRREATMRLNPKAGRASDESVAPEGTGCDRHSWDGASRRRCPALRGKGNGWLVGIGRNRNIAFSGRSVRVSVKELEKHDMNYFALLSPIGRLILFGSAVEKNGAPCHDVDIAIVVPNGCLSVAETMVKDVVVRFPPGEVLVQRLTEYSSAIDGCFSRHSCHVLLCEESELHSSHPIVLSLKRSGIEMTVGNAA